MPKLLTKESEQRLIDALESVADLVQDGMGPDEALAKAASQHQVPVGHVKLMVYGYNTGRTEQHRLSHDDVLDKAGSFPLADTEKVLRILYPDDVQTQAQQKKAVAISDQYRSPPCLDEKRKAAELAARTPARKPVPDLPASQEHKIKSAYFQCLRDRQSLEQQRMETTRLFDAMNRKTQEVATYFKRAGCLPFPEVKSNVELLFGEHGAALMRYLEKKEPCLSKQAEAIPDAHPADVNKEPYRSIKACVDLAEAFTSSQQKYEKMAVELLKAAEERLRPFGPTRDLPGPVVDSEWSKEALISGVALGALGTQVGRGLAEKWPSQDPTEKLVRKYQNQLSDPQHEAELLRINTQAAFNDIMNDPVVSGYNIDEAAENWNEITQLAPHAATQTGLMRALMRKRLQQGALDPYEVDMLVKIENNLKLRDAPARGVMFNEPEGVLA